MIIRPWQLKPSHSTLTAEKKGGEIRAETARRGSSLQTSHPAMAEIVVLLAWIATLISFNKTVIKGLYLATT